MPKRIVIIGGMAGGANAAARARRVDEHAEIVVYERSGYISLANCGLPYYLGGEITNRNELLVQSPRSFKKRYNVDVHVNHEVIHVDPARKTLQIRDVSTNQLKADRYDTLILAPGAAPIRSNLPGIDLPNIFTFRFLEETDMMFKRVSSGEVKTAVIVGAGYIGLEVAEQLHRRGVNVHIIELLDQVLPNLDREMAWPVAHQLIQHGIQLRVRASAEGFIGGDKVEKVRLGDGTEVPADMVILSMGIKPELDLARQMGVKIGSAGGIVVDDRMATSIPDVFAVGDAVEMPRPLTKQAERIPLAGPANKQGRVAGHFAADCNAPNLMRFQGAIGSSIVRVFDVVAGKVGLSEKEAQKLGLAYQAIYSVRTDIAGYYPGANPLTTKMLFDPDTGKVLGAQIIGKGGVAKRIDVLATLMHFGGTIDDLAQLDLCYAPPFNSAKDPVNIVAFIAQNVRSGLSRVIGPAELDRDYSQFRLIDLRSPGELEAKGKFLSGVNIPVDELRSRLNELDKGQPTVVSCQVGLRGLIGERILAGNAFADVRNLTGGFHIWNWYNQAKKLAGDNAVDVPGK